MIQMTSKNTKIFEIFGGGETAKLSGKIIKIKGFVPTYPYAP